MEKTHHQSSTITSSSSTTTTATNIQTPLKSLNKSSYKISKPPSSRTPIPKPDPPNPNPNPNSDPPPPPPPPPPVYNIDKSDFRNLVQKLTGCSSPPPPPPPPPPAAPTTTSRLHRIRPPPLSHLSPSPSLGPTPSLSPLPPLPTVSATAESPITAYMRRLRGGPSPTSAAPLSPLGFGCVSAYGMMLSPSLLMPPTSPRMPMPSPR